MLKQLGAIYLILGTCVAAGLLGLPIVTADLNFLSSSLIVITAWLTMSIGAWCLLKVNLWFDTDTNLITMSERTLGALFKWLTWIIYLILLYSLICAYLAGSGDMLQALLHSSHINIARWLCTTLAAIILGSIVYLGTHSVDLVNRLIMSIKLSIFLIVLGSVIPYSHIAPLMQGQQQWEASSFLVIMCAFGYAIIIPTLRTYLNSNEKQLTQVLIIGGTIPVIFYLAWIAIIQGAIPRFGPHSLTAMEHSANTNSMLMQQISQLTHHTIIKSLSIIFISICSITGFLGVSISLFDFLADGLHWSKSGVKKIYLALLTFLPPLIIVIAKPSLFVLALSYAGACCIYILVLLPVIMYIKGKTRGLTLKKR